MHRVGDASAAHREYCVASLVSSFQDLKLLATKVKHFWHERHAIEPSVRIQRAKNFPLAPHFNPVAYTEFLSGHQIASSCSCHFPVNAD
jgi:hypothetical protein